MEKRPNKSWEDPWLAGKRAADEARKATFDGATPEGQLTRQACVFVGAKYMAACTLAAVVLPAAAALFGWPTLSEMAVLSFKAAFIVLPPAGLAGAVIALETYKLLYGLRKFKEIKWYVWVIFFFLCVPHIMLPFLLQYLRRKWIIQDLRPPGWLAPILYASMFLLLAYISFKQAVFHGSRSSYLETTELCMAGSILAALFLGDCLIVNVLGKARNEGRLLPPPAHKFQFSLGAMLATVLGLGAYVSALVLIFRGK